jgi:hypothetical protein
MTTDVSQARFLAVAVMSSALLAACVPSDKVPVTGHVSLGYERTTDSGVYVKLTNGSARPISLQGSFDIWKRGIEIKPGITAIECMTEATFEQEPLGFADPPDFVSVPSGERVRVIVPSALPQRFKGHRCQLHLFIGDAGIGDVDFEP